jgi:hypothetical protein
MDAPGDLLLEHLMRAESSVVLVAPFIKRETLNRLLDIVRPGVPLTCYTRWRPEEIVAGVSDLSIWPLLRARNAALYLRYDLHAKVFRADEVCLIGSANLTLAALGWKAASNLEILIDFPADHRTIVDFFLQLNDRAVRVTDEIYSEMEDLVGLFSRTPAYTMMADRERRAESLASWLPRCRVPGNHNLYRTYTKQWNMVSGATYEDAMSDIVALGIPEGIDQEVVFLRQVATLLRQTPAVALVSERSREAIQPAEGQRLITEELGFGNGPNAEITGEEWTTLRTWIITFLPKEFRERQGQGGPELIKGTRIA